MYGLERVYSLKAFCNYGKSYSNSSSNNHGNLGGEPRDFAYEDAY